MKSERFCTFVKLLFITIISLIVVPSFAGPGRTTYQAKIVKPDGYPLEASNVNFRFTIMDPSGNCILYAENYSNISMASTGGLISFSLGSGIKSYPVSATTFVQVFSNITPSLSCAAGGPLSYTPLADDSRKIVMQFNDGSGWQTLPSMNINAVPYAMYANEAQTLNGKTVSDFVLENDLPGCVSGEALFYSGTGFSCVSATGAGAVTSGSITAALGYTPLNSTSFTSVSNDLNSVSSSVANAVTSLLAVSGSVYAVSSTVSSLSATVANLSTAVSGILISQKITSLNGSTSATQTFAIGNSGTNFSVSTLNGVHTFNIPYASQGSVVGGLLSNADYQNFQTGIITDSRLVNVSGVVSGTQYSKVTVDGKGRVISGSQITAAEINSLLSVPSCGVNQFLSFNGTSFSCATDSGSSGTVTSIAAAGVLSATTGANPILSLNYSNEFTVSGSALSLMTAGVVPGTYVKMTVDNKGRVVSSSALTASDVTTALGFMPSSGTAFSSVDLGSASATGILSSARLPAFFGDVFSVSGSASLSLVNSGVNAGTYSKITVDSKGRVVSSSNLVNADITTALGYTAAESGSVVSSQWQTSGTAITYSSGNVGIGVSQPTAQLQLGTNMYILDPALGSDIYFAGAGYLTAQHNFYINIDGLSSSTARAFIVAKDRTTATSGTELFRIDESGNMGIGTSTPTERLSVVGLIESTSGGIKFPDGSIQTTASSSTAGLRGAAVAWVAFSGATGVIQSSFNVNSVSRTGTGKYVVNFSQSLADANYAVVTGGVNTGNGDGAWASVDNTPGSGKSVSGVRIVSWAYNGGLMDYPETYVAIYQGNGTASLTNLFTENGSSIYRTTGNVGIGTNSPNSALDVSGTLRVSQICDRNGSNCQTIANGWTGSSSATAGVSQITAVAPLLVSGSATNPQLSLATSGSVSGQTLRFDGTNWQRTKLLYTDLINSTASSPWPASSCTAGQAIIWSSATDSFLCSTLQIAAAQLPQANLASGASGGVTGVLPVANGGTGQTSFTTNTFLLGNGTSALSPFAMGTSGSVLRSNGAGTVPSWTTLDTLLQAVNNSMVSNWPDALYCNDGTDFSVLHIDTKESSANRIWYSKASASHNIQFNATTGAYASNTAFTGNSVCINKSISTLVAENRYFNVAKGPVGQWLSNGTTNYYNAGSVVVGAASAVTSAIFEVSSTTKGFLGPRLTTTQRDGIASAAAGLMIYNLSLAKYQFFDGNSWEDLGSGASSSVSGTLGFRVGHHANNASITFTGPTDYIPDTEIYDTHGAFSLATHEFTAPQAGYYLFGWNFYVGGASTTARRVYLMVDGGSGFVAQSVNGDVGPALNGTNIVYLAVGHRAKLIIPSGYSLDTYSGYGHNSFWGVKVSTGSTGLTTLDLGSVSATGTLAAARLPAFAGGDVSSVSGSSVLTLANSGVNAGTYNQVTVDSKGRVTSGSLLTATQISTILGYTPVSASAIGSGSSSATIMTSWPDAIRCRDIPSGINYILYLSGDYDSTFKKYYATSRASSGAQNWMIYNPDGTYFSNLSLSTNFDCVASALSISQLYLAGQAFNFLGTTGGTSATTGAMSAWESKSFNTNYQAATDGFVVAWGASAYLLGYTDATATPTTKRLESEGNVASAGRPTLTMPVRKNDYWRVTLAAGSGGGIAWVPLTGVDSGVWSINGSDVYKLSGNLGLGTATPSRNLVVNNTAGNTFASITSSDAGVASLLLGDQSSDFRGQVRYDNTDDSMAIWTGGLERLRISNSGNLGIGTTNPTTALEITGATSGYVKMYESGAARFYRAIASNLSIADFASNTGGSDTVQMSVRANGTVGIGTTSPQATLDVSGSVRMGASVATCNSTIEGSQRYNSTSKVMEYCNGTSWLKIGSQISRKYARLATSGALTSGAGAITTLSWASAVEDTSSFYAAGSPTRITIPAGVTRVKLCGSIMATSGSSITMNYFQILKNNADFSGAFHISGDAADNNWGGLACTPALTVTAGDYFELRYYSRDVAITFSGTRTWFTVEEQ